MSHYRNWVLLCAVLVGGHGTAFGALITTTYTYQSTISSDFDGALDLKAQLNFNSDTSNAPIAVVMHGFSFSTGNFAAVLANAQRLRDRGFFVLSVAMRGRDGSDGVRDSGGMEIHDIFDAVEAVKADTSFNGLIDPSTVYITGYSGGGGNVMSALTKFPDYFRAGASFFGMSDYGYDDSLGWYANGASSSHRAILRTDIGTPGGSPLVTDRYMARDSSLAARNNPYSEIHLFTNASETVCPITHHLDYLNSATAHASFPGEFNNITIHTGMPGVYYDFDNNTIDTANEQQYWPHGEPTADQQAAAESWFLDRLLSGQIAQPVLNSSDELFVAGYVRTKPFTAWIGDGQNGAADLEYSLTSREKSFMLNITSLDNSLTGHFEIDTADMLDERVLVLVDGALVDSFEGGGWYTFAELGDGQTLTLRTIPEPAALTSLMLGVSMLLSVRARRPRGCRRVGRGAKQRAGSASDGYGGWH